jgi:hypothetical protein
MSRIETPMEVALKGAVAGLVGTVLLTLAMRRLQPLVDLVWPVQVLTEQADDSLDPTSRLAEKVAVGVFETELPMDVSQTIGKGIHWGYGALWGTIYGIVQSSIHLPIAAHGSVLGFVVWMVGPLGLVPAMRLSTSPLKKPMPQPLRSLFFHEIYGLSVAVAYKLLSRK